MMTHVVVFTTDMGYSDMVGASLVSVQRGLNLVGLLITGPLSDRIPIKKVSALTHLINIRQSQAARPEGNRSFRVTFSKSFL